MFCCTLLYVHSSIAIILMGKRELIALLNLSSLCLVMVERLFLAVPRGCLQFVIVVFPDHTHLLFFSLVLISILRSTINDNLSKFHLLTKVWSLLINSIFKDNSVISSIPNYFNISETPIICYKFHKPIRSTISNFNKIVTYIDIDSNTPDS